MKRQKSRTLIGRTISRVKSRLVSFGSSAETQSANPLVAPPASPTRTPRAYRTVPQRSPRNHTLRAPKSARPASKDEQAPGGGIVGQNTLKRRTVEYRPAGNTDLSTSRIAVLGVNISTWTVFGTHNKYAATAYVSINLVSIVGVNHENAKISSGNLYNLKITPTITGPGAIIKNFGDVTRPLLVPGGEQWTLVLHIGIKDTSLAAKLSTSFRSLGGRLRKVSNLDVINRWLHVLQEDTTPQSAICNLEPVEVQVKITFKHSLLPSTTMLVEERTITIAMTEDEVERAYAEPGHGDGDGDDEDEERIREMRVLGAPWL